jgi:hypothetical protein
MMGLRSSPYVTIKQMHLAYEVANGNRLDPRDALRWDHVVLNLPGDPSLTPLLPWVYRGWSDGKLAGATPGYIDDLRPVGCSEDDCWAVLHQTASHLGYLGIQNASRKTRPPRQEPGAWAGTIAHTGPFGVGVKCSQDKWDKAKALLAELAVELTCHGSLDHMGLESKWGFFIHLQRTYPTITPFLKGIHLTLDGWCPNRDRDFWKLSASPEDNIWDDTTESWVPLSAEGQETAPCRVRPAPRLQQDLESLNALFHPLSPPLRYLQPTSISVCLYGFVHAGAGFGSSFQLPSGHVLFRQGIWGRDADNSSSNYRELRNLMEALEDGLSVDDHANTEVFVFYR